MGLKVTLYLVAQAAHLFGPGHLIQADHCARGEIS